MRFVTLALTALTAVAVYGGAAAANTLYRCTDDTGMILVTSDAGASRICKLLSASARRCADESCAIRISKDQDGRLYINGTVNSTRVHYPVAAGASAVTICIRGQCKAQ
jgi:hypothetical protein